MAKKRTQPPAIASLRANLARRWVELNWLNGSGRLTEQIVATLEKLTSRADLRYTTFLPWGQALADVSLVKRYRVWCPVCLEEQRHKQQKQAIPRQF